MKYRSTIGAAIAIAGVVPFILSLTGRDASALSHCPKGSTLACDTTDNGKLACACQSDAPAPPPPLPPPFGSPRHYLPLDSTHAIVTSLKTWNPVSTSPPAPCNSLGLCWTHRDWSTPAVDFSATVDEGVDLASAALVETETNYPFLHVVFDGRASQGVEFLHLTGELNPPGATSLVTASLTAEKDLYVADGDLGSQNSVPPAGGVIFALQTLDANNNWNDVATTLWPSTPVTLDSPYTMNVSATLPASSIVRAVLRQGAAPWTGFLAVKEAQLTLPECIPDGNNPGLCIP